MYCKEVYCNCCEIKFCANIKKSKEKEDSNAHSVSTSLYIMIKYKWIIKRGHLHKIYNQVKYDVVNSHETRFS